MRRLFILAVFLATLGVSAGCKCKDCKCGCTSVGGVCITCNNCDLVGAWDGFKEATAKVGDVLDEAKAITSDPSGYIRNTIINRATDLIGDQLEQALGVSNVCNNREKEAFGGGDWHPYFGKRLWQGRGAAMLVGSLFPATAGLAANEIMGELRAQYGTALALLEQAAQDAGDDLKAALTRMFDTIIRGATSGNLQSPVIDKSTFGLKGAILQVSCSNKAAGFKLPSEGYYQLAFAYRIKTPNMRNVTPPIRGVPLPAPVPPPSPAQPREVCKHDCKRCGQDGPCFMGKCSGGCRKCCWTP